MINTVALVISSMMDSLGEFIQIDVVQVFIGIVILALTVRILIDIFHLR